MSLQLLNKLAGNTQGDFRKFIDGFAGKPEPRIAWYPSAGEDFRALLYLSNGYSELNPATGKEPSPPDVFLFTDYYPWENSRFLDYKGIYTDDNTGISVVDIEELPGLQLPVLPELVQFPKGSKATNRSIFMNVMVYSEKLGAYQVPVIYCFAESTVFFRDILLLYQSKITHVIHVRYGGGLGGSGTASGVWILRALKLLGTEILISDNNYYWQTGDEFALTLCPILQEQAEPQFETIRILSSEKWSNHGDVSWNLVRFG
ncbi:MAG: hypothetical protein BroJett042_04120 [Bacteroidota bacterium]|nr:MAG: hypothetical protein BroJett042_04120 [Bacteroidota bacterium]